MRKSRNKFKIIVFSIFTVIIISISIGYGILKQDINIGGKASLSINETVPPPQTDYIVTYVINDKWYSGGKYYYRITVTLLNNTSTTLNGWTITSNAPTNPTLVNYSNTSAKLKGQTLEFKNLTYNASVPSKQSVSFEFQISTTDANYQMGNFIVNGSGGEPSEPEKPDEIERTAEINFVQDNYWEAAGYYYYQFTCNIINTGKATINSWKFDSILFKEVTVDQIWNANYIQNSETSITFEGTGYNGIIDIGQSKSFGIVLKSTHKKVELTPINTVLK